MDRIARYVMVAQVGHDYRLAAPAVSADLGDDYEPIDDAAMQRVAQAAKLALSKEITKAKQWKRARF